MDLGALREKYPYLSDRQLALLFGQSGGEVGLEEQEGGQGGGGGQGPSLKSLKEALQTKDSGMPGMADRYSGAGLKNVSGGPTSMSDGGVKGGSSGEPGLRLDTGADGSMGSEPGLTGASDSGQAGYDTQGGDSGSDGNWLGAAAGAYAGWNQGTKNARKDEDKRDHRNDPDGFGKYNNDHRAEAGGAVGGGFVGYFSKGYAVPLVPWLSKTLHPGLEKLTRETLVQTDKIGGADLSVHTDPIGSWTSGKYKKGELAKATVAPGLSKYIK